MHLREYQSKIIDRKTAKISGLTRYFNNKPCPQGHIAERMTSNGTCVTCLCESKKKGHEKMMMAQRRHRKENKEQWAAYKKKNYYKHHKKSKERARKNYEKNKEVIRLRVSNSPQVKIYKKEYSKRPEVIKRRNFLIRERLKNDYVFNLNNRVRCRIASLLRGKKSRFLQQSLGYSMQDLKTHLEKQFVRGMSWENMQEWHIDHIVPLACLKYKDTNDPIFKFAWALSNLRPIWKEENLKKHAKRIFLI